MLKLIIKALIAANTLCQTLQQNPDGARYLVALAGLAAVIYILHWVNR